MKKVEIKLIHEVRAVKGKKELGNIIKAQSISEQVLQDVLKFIKTHSTSSGQAGITEIEVAEFIKKSFIKYKAPILSFLPIVAFGKNTANIHHIPSKSKLKIGDTIMLDFGTTYKHYCSDMTRTYFYGKINERQKKMYLAVLEAMNRAMDKIKKGEKRAGIIDKVAREYLNRKFKIKKPKKIIKGEQLDGFPHGLGHGVGTVIHEWPNFKPKSEDILPIGSVMTIEPGLYFKGFGGIRIEDMILITKDGYKNLTNMSKDLESAIIKI